MPRVPRRHRAGPTAGAALLTVVLAAAACGGDGRERPSTTARTGDGRSSTADRGAQAGAQADATVEDEAARAAVAPSRERLARAGYAVTQTRVAGVQPPPAGALETSL